MFFAVAVVLVVAWLLGFSVFHVAGSLIHLLLLLALISIVWHFMSGRRTTICTAGERVNTCPRRSSPASVARRRVMGREGIEITSAVRGRCTT
jgi:hypothetical protein